MNKNPMFILAGNGPYENRGCEAIVRGTVKILRHYYENPSFVCVSFFQDDEQFKKQCNKEYDKSIIHKKIQRCRNKSDFQWWKNRLLGLLLPKCSIYKYMYKDILYNIEDSKAVLSIGGDNYSLDYGIPKLFVKLDDLVLERRKTVVIWGASVGPFDKIPKYEKYMLNHLRNVTAIFARESSTIDYLKKNNVINNVYDVADPAFLMDPMEPKSLDNELKIQDGSIGINLSPLMAKYVTNGNLLEWTNIAAKIISSISKRTSRTIYLIPHVTTPTSNDHIFLKNIISLIADPKKVILIDENYSASETKWIISKMFLFVGSRTHATIAALSSCVPTLSLGYSIKAQGINKDIFGHEFYCLNPNDLLSDIVVEKIEYMLKNHNEITDTIYKNMPLIKEKSMLAGKHLLELIG